MSKLKPETWNELPRSSKLASVLWPSLTPPHIQAEMQSISRGEGRTSPLDAKVQSERARSSVRVNYGQRNYDNVPGLRRKQQRSK
jgi:hypothetical protein